MPVTLAVVRTLLFEVSDERYAIPLAHVVETVRVEDGDIHEINHRGVVLWRGELLPVVDGAALVGAGAVAGEAARKYTVVVHAGTRRRGVLVDRLHRPPERRRQGTRPGARPYPARVGHHHHG